MVTTRLLLGALIVLGAMSLADAAPKKGPNGETCILTGTERRDGTDKATGEKFNCLWDSCTFCQDGSTNIDCLKRETAYSNARDCKAVSATAPGGMTIVPGIEPSVLDPGVRTSPTRRPPMARPRGLIQGN